MIFEDQSENHNLAQKVILQINDFDYISFMLAEKIEDPEEYYDINRVNKLKDKLTSEVGGVLV